MRNKAKDEICVVCDKNYRKELPQTNNTPKVEVRQTNVPVVNHAPVRREESTLHQTTPENTPHIREQRALLNIDVTTYADEVITKKLKFLLKRLDDETDMTSMKNIIELIEKLHGLKAKLA